MSDFECFHLFTIQMLDMIKPAKEGCISLADLKNCKLTPIFFDTFFNLEKYLEHEQKDPFANLRVMSVFLYIYVGSSCT